MSAAEDYGDITADQVRALDAGAVAAGVSVGQLMELAGWQVARCAWDALRARPGAVLVLAGHGNNGGDAVVAARHLLTWGCTVTVMAVAAEPADAGDGALAVVRTLGATVVQVAEPTGADRVGEAAGRAALVVDGLLGTGLRGPARPLHAAVIAALSGARVLAVDLPSGLDGTTGAAAGACVSAAATCTLTAVKRGVWRARDRCGELHVADIGMPLPAWRAAGVDAPRLVRGGALLRVP